MENVNEVLADANAKIAKSFEALKGQFAGLRTGKASPALVDGIKVNYYGAPTPIKNLATISTPEPPIMLNSTSNSRTTVESTPKYFANPPHTPAIFLSVVDL